jgi:hypothetical protein
MEPISTIAAVFAGAQAAVEGVKKAVALGKEIRDVYQEISVFFQAQGKIEAEAKKQEFEKAVAPIERKRSATQRALDIVFMRREMQRMETELREMLIYQFSEAGLYAEMCQERDRIIAEERAEQEEEQRKINEAILEEKRRLRTIQKEKQERMDAIINSAAVFVGASISIAIICGIIWMFQQGGRL